MPTLNDLRRQVQDIGDLLGKSMPPATRASLLRAQMALKTRARLVAKKADLGEKAKKPKE